MSKQPWWNPILWGDKSLVQSLREALANKQVPPEILNQYNQAFNQMRLITPVIQAINTEKMQSQEFLLFVNIQQQVISSSGEYQSLNICLTILIHAMEKRHYLKTLEFLEKESSSFTEQSLYSFVGEILETLPNPEYFQESLRKQVKSILSFSTGEAVTKQVIDHIKSYAKSLEKIAQDDTGIQLLYLFKNYKSSQSIVFMLEMLIILLNKYATEDMSSVDNLAKDIEKHYAVFEELGKIFGIPKGNNNPPGYTRIIQYLILRYKYQGSYLHFERLSELLLQWQKPYQIVKKIQSEYPIYEYKQPKEFAEKILGVEIYEKYKDYLPKADNRIH